MGGRVAGKIAIVTGAASARGIGFAIAAALAREGARVALTDIVGDDVETRAAVLRDLGHIASAFRHDVSVESSWSALFDQVESRLGPVDILVNNAAIAILKPMTLLSLHDLKSMIDVNLCGAFIGSKIALASMRGRGGAIVNISSVSGLSGFAGNTGYGATKGGIRAMTKAIAIEGAKDRIRCNAIFPGAIWTDIQFAAREREPDTFGNIEAIIPMGRIGDPADIAEAVVYLASDAAGYVTGAELIVDGGLTAA